MRRRSFYLDTNVFSQLADPDRTDQEIRRRLERLVRCGACEIIGAFGIIEEFAAMARSKPEHFARSLELFWRLVGDRVLEGRNRLLIREMKKGNMLSRKEAFLDSDTLRRLLTLSLDDLDGWAEVAEGVRGQGKQFAGSMHGSADKVEEEMLKTVNFKEIRKNAAKFQVDERTIRSWFSGLLRLNRETVKLPDDESKWPDVAQLPCARAFLSIHIALSKKHHKSWGHKYKLSDHHDVTQYTNAGMAGCLVTSDRAFRDTSRLITWKPFPVMDPKEFWAKVQRM